MRPSRHEYASTAGSVRPTTTSYGRYLSLADAAAWFGIDFMCWAWDSYPDTPLWLSFQEEWRSEESRSLGEIRRALEPLKQKAPWECFEEDGGHCQVADERAFFSLVPTENLIRTVRVTDRADVGPANDGNVSIAAVHSVNVDEWLASFGRSSGRRAACTVFRRRPSMAVVRPRDDGSCGAGRPRAASQ